MERFCVELHSASWAEIQLGYGGNDNLDEFIPDSPFITNHSQTHMFHPKHSTPIDKSHSSRPAAIIYYTNKSPPPHKPTHAEFSICIHKKRTFLSLLAQHIFRLRGMRASKNKYNPKKKRKGSDTTRK